MTEETAKLLIEALDRHSKAIIEASENIEKGLIYQGSRR